MHEATARLLELGLSDKEASVYLAMLELGPASVQEIAKKSGVNRSTSYFAIEILQKRGLASSTQHGSKMLFTAESPSRLAAVLNRERQEIDEKKKKLEESIPYFLGLYNAIDDKPQVRFFEGPEGISAVREIMQRPRGEYLSFTAIDEGTIKVSKMNEQQRLKMSRKVHGRFIYSLKPGIQLPKMDLTTWEVRELPYGAHPFTGEINIIDNKVAAIVMKGKATAFVVENREMADLFRAMFNAAWRVAKPVDKRKL